MAAHAGTVRRAGSKGLRQVPGESPSQGLTQGRAELRESSSPLQSPALPFHCWQLAVTRSWVIKPLISQSATGTFHLGLSLAKGEVTSCPWASHRGGSGLSSAPFQCLLFPCPLTPNCAACVRTAGAHMAPAPVHTGFRAGSHCSAPFQCLLLPRQRRRADAAGAFPPRRPHWLRHPPPRAAAAHPDPRRGGLCRHHQQLHATRLHRGQGLCQGVGRGAAGHQDGRGSAGLPGEEEEEQKGLWGGAGKGKVPLFQRRGHRGLSHLQ